MSAIRRLLSRGRAGAARLRGTADLQALLVERVAAHFDGARVQGDVVHTGFADVEVACRVADVDGDALVSASLFFEVRGGPFGPAWSFASISGYGDDPVLAVVEGACMWTCTLRGLLRSAFRDGEADPDAITADVELHGRRFRLITIPIDRAFLDVDAGPGAASEALSAARAAYDAPTTLAERLVASGSLPPLLSGRASLLSAFTALGEDQQIREAKVRGADWPPASDALAIAAPVGAGTMVMLRELAILIPLDSPMLTRERITGSLRAIGSVRTESYGAAGWRGWERHLGTLGEPMNVDALATIETSAGRLPADLRDFLLETAASGAGPGYGLEVPHLVAGALLLAHAGCGVAWVMRLDPAHRGEVWLDARACDDTFQRVAGSFSEWYLDWLDASVGSATPWVAWDSRACACSSVLAQQLERAPRAAVDQGDLSGVVRSVELRSAGPYLPVGATLDPSHGCVALYASYRIPESVWATAGQPLA